MARSARNKMFENGGYYHVFTRGNDRRRLFRTAGDYRFMLETATLYQNEFKLGIVHYCLMPNHIHLMLYTEVARHMPEYMKKILQVYAAYFRRRYHSTGFVFENRYKSKLIRNNVYLLECARYIERNPLRAKLVDDLEEWKWSSYQCCGLGKPDPMLKAGNPLYLCLDTDPHKRMALYRSLFAEGRLFEDVVDKEFAIE